jgi:hypothetical protein
MICAEIDIMPDFIYLSDYQGYEHAEEVAQAIRDGSLFTV